MFPNTKQFRRWTLPTRWNFLASVASLAGVVLAILALWVSVIGPHHQRASERRELVFAAAQELRSNSELLSHIASLTKDESINLGPSPYSTEKLKHLSQVYFSEITKGAYGEEKYIYQQIIMLERWLRTISSLQSDEAVREWEASSDYTVQDVLYLNDFLWWYLYPTIDRELSASQRRGLGWHPYPDGKFRVPEKHVNLRYFVHDGRALHEFVDYLGYLD